MTRVLFTGYAPVHFVCFRPMFDALRALAGMEVFVSGGLQTRDGDGDGYLYDTQGLYGRFGLPAGSVLEVEQIAELDVDVLFVANTKPIAPRSAAATIQIFHGMSFRNRAIRAENLGCDHYFLIGPYMRRAFETRGLFSRDDERIVQVGFPKTDGLLDGSLERSSVLAEHGVSGDRPVIFYAPTGAHDNSLETMGEDVLRRLSATNAFDILVKPHDHPKKPIDWHARLAPLESEHLHLVRDADVIRTLSIADVLITDASSVANEYTLCDRPIVFLDVPELLAAAAAEDSRLDLNTWGRKAGDIVNAPHEAVGAIERALSDPQRHAHIRAEMADDFFFNPGRATTAAVSWLTGQLN